VVLAGFAGWMKEELPEGVKREGRWQGIDL